MFTETKILLKISFVFLSITTNAHARSRSLGHKAVETLPLLSTGGRQNQQKTEVPCCYINKQSSLCRRHPNLPATENDPSKVSHSWKPRRLKSSLPYKVPENKQTNDNQCFTSAETDHICYIYIKKDSHQKEFHHFLTQPGHIVISFMLYKDKK